MTELLLIRHGETDFNRQLRFQGHLDSPLNTLGHAQAARLAARLRDETFDAVFSSDLARARQTAAPLIALNGQPLHTDAAWREQSFGVMEGLDAASIRSQHPAHWAAWARHDADTAPEGGESYRAFHQRVMQALQQLVQARAGQRLAVFTHGGVLDMVWRQAHGLPLAGPRSCVIPNAGVNRLRWDGPQIEILTWADDSHLHDMADAPAVIPMVPPQRA